MKNKSKRSLGLCILLLLFIGPALCVEQIPVYTVADSTGDWGFPSPYGHYSRGPGYIRMSLIFDTLVWKDQNGYVPALAESWNMVESGAFVFNLRKNVTWNDGIKFTANDVVFTVNYIKKHPYQWVNSEPLRNAEAVDDYTVKYISTIPMLHFWK